MGEEPCRCQEGFSLRFPSIRIFHSCCDHCCAFYLFVDVDLSPVSVTSRANKGNSVSPARSCWGFYLVIILFWCKEYLFFCFDVMNIYFLFWCKEFFIFLFWCKEYLFFCFDVMNIYFLFWCKESFIFLFWCEEYLFFCFDVKSIYFFVLM